MNIMLKIAVLMKMQTTIPIIVLLLTANTTHAETITLKTRAGNNIGVSLSYYRYEEPDLMSLVGGKIGLDINSTKTLQHNYFIRGDMRYAFGTVDYNSNGTGSTSGELDLYTEARGLLGKDWGFKNTGLALYTGFGYRFLFNDGRGITSTGAAGYRRESNYFYIPIGVIHRLAIKDQARLASTLEYDHLLKGKQISRLSDGGQGYSDLTNNQNSGYGLKLSIIYEKDKWVIGPYAHYWYINDSDITLVYQNGILVGTGLEPRNNTIEFGLKVGQQF